jgi:hypothetical protein
MNGVDLMDQREISASWRACLNHKSCQGAEGSQKTDSRLPDGENMGETMIIAPGSVS